MNQILKEYSLKDIEKILPDYRLVKIEDVNGREIVNYNNPSTDIRKHWQQALKRFNSDIIPDDYYYICLSFSARKAKEPDKFLVKKGNPVSVTPPQNFSPPQNFQSKNDLITVSAALDYITQIAQLKTDIVRLELENKQLKEECAELSAELEEMKDEGLSEGKESSTVEYLKETAPGLMALADRFFEIEEKKIGLEEKKIQAGVYQPNKKSEQKIKRPKIQVKQFDIGSDEHLQYIRLLFNSGKETELNKELDKLEEKNPEKYEQIGNELNLFEEDENEN